MNFELFQKRLEYLDLHGPSRFSFTFQTLFEAGDEFRQGIDGAGFVPCGAA
jgi:hypothetical protein